VKRQLQQLQNNISDVSAYFFPCRCIQRTVDVCPYSVCKQCPDSAFHTFSVRSVLPLIIMLPDICDDQTPPVWPTNVRRHWKDKHIHDTYSMQQNPSREPTGSSAKKFPFFYETKSSITAFPGPPPPPSLSLSWPRST
jgi:hypothetical protein